MKLDTKKLSIWKMILKTIPVQDVSAAPRNGKHAGLVVAMVAGMAKI